MAPATDPSNLPANRLLRKLAPADLALLSPHLEPVALKRRQVLERPNRPITHLYFVEQGIASVATPMDKNVLVEIGLIGREGVTGLAVILGSSTSPHSTFVQVAGSARRIAVKPMREALGGSQGLQNLMLRYAHCFMAQTAHNAVANARGTIARRLARWLLMASDRVDGDSIVLTHEFLAVMLGTRRPGVTVAMHDLSKLGLIRNGRGAVALLDRDGLLAHAGDLYGTPETEYRRQIGNA